MTSELSIAMIGCRGVPASYGGVERHVEEIGARLAARGHQVTVYCRSGYRPDRRTGDYRGMRTVTLPALRSKHLEALSHSALATIGAVLARHDVFHFHALGPGVMAPLARLSPGSATVLTVHGLDYDRGKWGSAASRVIRGCERVGARWAHMVVVVAPDLVGHYRSGFGIEPAFIPNGVNRPSRSVAVPHGRYVLSVGRLTPEKRALALIEGFRRLEDPDLRLIIVGGSSHTDGYVEQLRRAAVEDPRVTLRGYVYGQELTDMYAGARLFVQPSYLEGMPLTVLEAAAHGAPLLTSDLPVHREVLGKPGPGRRWFTTESLDDLERQLRSALAADDEAERRAAAEFGEEIVQRYSWDDVTDRLEQLYIAGVRRRARLRRTSRPHLTRFA